MNASTSARDWPWGLIALRLAAEGARVALVSRSRDQLDAAAREIEASGGKAAVAPADVSDRASVAAAVKAAQAQLGPIDLLVNNAGVPGPFGPIWQVDPDEWWRSQAIHIRAPMLFMHHVLPGMVERNRGRVICVSAIASRLVAPNLSAYCTGKIAQNRLVAEAAAELADTKVAVFAIDPGFAATRLAHRKMIHDTDDPKARIERPEALPDRILARPEVLRQDARDQHGRIGRRVLGDRDARAPQRHARARRHRPEQRRARRDDVARLRAERLRERQRDQPRVPVLGRRAVAHEKGV